MKPNISRLLVCSLGFTPLNPTYVWIKFRDTNCDFEVYQSRDGTGYGGFLSNCLERMTKARTQELQEWKR